MAGMKSKRFWLVVGGLLFVILLAVIFRAQTYSSTSFGLPPAGISIRNGGTLVLTDAKAFAVWQAGHPGMKGRKVNGFTITNGTPRPLLYHTIGNDYRVQGSWVSNGDAAATLRASQPAELQPFKSANFWASVPTSSPPWRIHVVCAEGTWVDAVRRRLGILNAPRKMTWPEDVWHGRKYELISDEVPP
jgi:hypothetical protein